MWSLGSHIGKKSTRSAPALPLSAVAPNAASAWTTSVSCIDVIRLPYVISRIPPATYLQCVPVSSVPCKQMPGLLIQVFGERFGRSKQVLEERVHVAEHKRPVRFECALGRHCVVNPPALPSEAVTVGHHWDRIVIPNPVQIVNAGRSGLSAEKKALSKCRSDRTSTASAEMWREQKEARTTITYISDMSTMRGRSEYFTLRLSSRSRAATREFKISVGLRKSLKYITSPGRRFS